jgi:hypothetical protein
MMDRVAELQEKMGHILAELRAAVDLSVQIRQQSPQAKKEVSLLWEKFLSVFLNYIKQKGKETRENLLDGLSWMRLSRM